MGWRLFALISGLGVALAGAAQAADTLAYGPAPSWVLPMDVPTDAPPPASGAVQVLMTDHQVRYGDDFDETYDDLAVKALTPAGLAAIGSVVRQWNPADTSVTINRVQIIRGDKVIDALDPDTAAGGDPFLVLRRETNLNAAVLDGALTATKQLGGLQVGDIVRFSSTTRTHDPVMGGMTADGGLMAGPVAHARVRLLWPKSKTLRWRTTTGFTEPKLTQTADGSELVSDRTDLPILIAPQDAPDRFSALGLIQISQFPDWQTLSRLFAPIYQKASTLAADSPLKAQAAAIKASNPTQAGQAMAALKLVQDQVRYVALAMGEGGLIPANADQTWNRRFGDCKGKTALLLALLNELGINAAPALVNADGGDGLSDFLPTISVFNHVIVRATIGGKVYWLDGARQGDTDLASIRVPSFDWALPVTAAGADLEKLVVAPPTIPELQKTLALDLRGGPTAAAPVHVELAYSGDDAISLRLTFASADKAQIDQGVIAALKSEFSSLKLDKSSYTDTGGVFTLIGDGQIDTNWYQDAQSRQQALQLANHYGYSDPPDRTTGLNLDAPVALAYPYYERFITRVTLPTGMAGFSLNGADSDISAGGVRMTRTSKLTGDVVNIDELEMTLATETPLADAKAASARFKAAPTDDWVLLRAPSGFKVSAQALDKAVQSNPGSAQALLDRAGATADTGKYADALKDYDAAVAAEPTLAKAWRARAWVKIRLNDLPGALADAEQGLKLEPGSEYGPYYRGLVRYAMRDYAGAAADYAAALKIDPNSVDALKEHARTLVQLKQPDQAKADLEAAIKLAPDDASVRSLAFTTGMTAALIQAPNGLFTAASMAAVVKQAYAGVTSVPLLTLRGVDLLNYGDTDGIADLNRSLALDPNQAPAYAALGGYYLRHDQAALGNQNWDKALALAPTQSNYKSRGSARLAAKDYAGAESDYRAAIAMATDPTNDKIALANIANAKGDPKAALSQLADLAAANPKSTAPLNARAAIFGQLKDYESQAKEYEKALLLQPTSSTLPNQIITAYEQARNYPAAMSALDRVIAATPNSAELLNDRCFLKAESKLQLDTALADCDAALKIMPGSAPIIDSRGMVHLQLGQYDAAISDYDAALKISPALSPSLYGRAIARQRTGDAAGAQADIAAAKRAYADIETLFAGYGLKP